MYIVLWSRRALCVMVFYMLAIATEITLSVMSFNVRTTLLVQAAWPLDNSTDTQAVSVYKHYKLNDIPSLPRLGGAFDLRLAVSVPLPIVMGIFVLLWFQSRLT